MIRSRLVIAAALVVAADMIVAPAVAAASGRIEGRVLRWPPCPAETTQPECTEAGLAATIVVSRASGGRATSLRAGSEGRFSVALPPGDYLIEAEAAGVPYCEPVRVSLRSGGTQDVEVRCDTGVR